MDRKEIKVRRGVATKIKKDLKVNYITIRTALIGLTDTELSDKIRKKALELGGVEIANN